MNDKDFKHGVGGYSNHKCRCEVCKEAKRMARQRYYAAHRKTIIDRYRLYYESNKDSVAQYKRRHYKDNRETIAVKAAQYRSANADVISERKRRYREENREIEAERKRLAYEAARDQHVARRKDRNARTLEQANRSNKHWTPQEDAVAMDLELSSLEVAFVLRRSINAVHGRRTNLRKKAMA